MKIMSAMKQIMCSCLVTGIAMLSLPTAANNIDAMSAGNVANHFLKQQVATGKTIASVSRNDLKLVHAEASRVAQNAKAYYAFNITGGGFIIIAGEDRANQVLGYSDQGRLDFNNLPDNFKALLDSYQEEIEFLQSHPNVKTTPSLRATNTPGVKPLITAIWGQELPYYLQCPVYQGEYCAVGCIATAMSQVMYYWKFPTSSPSLNSFYCYEIGQTVPALPETVFDYSKMLTSYCHWDWDQGLLIQDSYTDEQAQAVAKLARYCGQAVRMGYHPDGSGAMVSDQRSGMIKFGYNSNAKDVSRSSWWYDNYSNEEWESMMRTELDARRPILYSANDVNGGGGHAFVCDGYDSNGLFHFNFGWYGTCDGWYTSTALNMTHRSGEVLKFNSGHEMLTGIEPPTYCLIEADGVNAPTSLVVLGEPMTLEALNVNIHTTNAKLNFIFSLMSESGKGIAQSSATAITTAGYTQGSSITCTITLPTSLEQGTYPVRFNYYTNSPRVLTAIDCECGYINVAGQFAKYNAPFGIEDVTTAIEYLLDDHHGNLTIDDLTMLIDALLAAE